MGGPEDRPDVLAGTEATPFAAAEAGRAGVSLEAGNADAPLILPCPLVVLGTTRESETGRPLGDLLRRIGYL